MIRKIVALLVVLAFLPLAPVLAQGTTNGLVPCYTDYVLQKGSKGTVLWMVLCWQNQSQHSVLKAPDLEKGAKEGWVWFQAGDDTIKPIQVFDGLRGMLIYPEEIRGTNAVFGEVRHLVVRVELGESKFGGQLWITKLYSLDVERPQR